VQVEAFVPEPPVEALGVRVVDRLARPDELQRHAAPRGRTVERADAELGAVIADDPGGQPRAGPSRSSTGAGIVTPTRERLGSGAPPARGPH
jgi:hypothetical protein